MSPARQYYVVILPLPMLKATCTCLSTEDGSFVARTKVDGSGVSAPMLTVGDSLIVQSNGGSLSAFKIQ